MHIQIFSRHANKREKYVDAPAKFRPCEEHSGFQIFGIVKKIQGSWKGIGILWFLW
jgi:hypothetical protein